MENQKLNTKNKFPHKDNPKRMMKWRNQLIIRRILKLKKLKNNESTTKVTLMGRKLKFTKKIQIINQKITMKIKMKTRMNMILKIKMKLRMNVLVKIRMNIIVKIKKKIRMNIIHSFIQMKIRMKIRIQIKMKIRMITKMKIRMITKMKIRMKIKLKIRMKMQSSKIKAK